MSADWGGADSHCTANWFNPASAQRHLRARLRPMWQESGRVSFCIKTFLRRSCHKFYIAAHCSKLLKWLTWYNVSYIILSLKIIYGLAVSLCSRCVICMMDFECSDPIRFLPCLHIYHVDCIDTWLMRSFTCPSCMEPVDAALLSSYETNWVALWWLLPPKSDCTFLAETFPADLTGSLWWCGTM